MRIKNFKEFNNKEINRIDEKWYHNLLAGLMLLTPSMSQAANNTVNLSKSEVTELSEEEATVYIEKLIKSIKDNEKEFKNVDQMIFQLEKIMDKYQDGEIGRQTMIKLAEDFIDKAKDMKEPVIFVKDHEKSDYTKINEVASYDTLITQEKPSEIYIDIYEEAFFKSGSYEMDKTNPLIQKVTDTIKAVSSNGYQLESVIIESSTDGQLLSNNLEKSLKKDGYEGNNMGLSEARNDEMKNILVDKTSIDGNMVMQNIKWKADSTINKDLRYNKVVLKMAKKEAGPSDIKVKENVVSVYYKVMDRDTKHKINLNIFKNIIKNMKIKKKGTKKVNLNPNRYKKCFFIK